MSSSKLPSSTHGSMSNQKRPTAKFHPSLWGDIFLSSPTTNVDAKTKLQHEELKEEVRRMIKVVMDDELLYKLRLIDTIKRLGVCYRFEREIEEVLVNIYKHDYKDDQTLETTSLQFRLLREKGLGVPCEWFNKFKDDEGNFNMSLTSDVKGLLELYEASYLRVHGEDILEEALGFTTTHLGLAKAAETIEYPLSALVSQALYRPIRKGLSRLEARRFISFYQDDPSHNKTLLKFAKLDFNLLQILHKEELSKISRWKNGLDLATKLPFARDRFVECYLWVLGVYFEPQYSFAREILVKTFVMTSIMDDTYDSYGTLEELQLLKNAIQRWDVDYIDQLPEYMKSFYKPLLDFYGEKEEAMIKQEKLYRVKYAKDAFKQVSEAYFVEAKWFNENYVPTMKEYMSNAVVSAGYIMLIVTSFVGMGDFVTPEIFNWASNNPKIIYASSFIARIMNDVTSHKFEQEKGDCASAVECYMREHAVSEEEACSELMKQVENAWKDINQELIFSEISKVVPGPVLTRILNFTRFSDVIYKNEDGYTHVGKNTKDGITSLLIDPISVSY
ncbi:(+)-delta-cadinene synthase isozyme XC14 [Gossypium hirsutum]|uniref:(+)-delta-cadinene synthase isozyme XC14 n=1 Tax=Gossypium hirsutum TaxID=3635 RepID=A0A1U8LU38_GOSHI|nr:(+)-delta-cadinene synthase isozyme XC14-like [Gossypium hirsutum]